MCAHGGEVEQFIRETLEEQRVRSECEPSEVAQIVGDAINDSKLPEFELPKKSIFTSKDKENDARYYSYDKSGRLISVEYAASPEKNEYYAYDKQGNILEKRIGNSIYKYTYDTANQLMEMESPEGKREYFYDRAGRLIIEKFNGEIDVEYKYGYLDKVIEVNRNGKTTKFAYDGFGMLAQKTFHDGSTEVWVWDGLALIRRGSDIYVNEPHISGGVPILSKTDEGVRYHEHDFLGTTLWSMDTKGNLVKDYQDTTIFGEGSIQKDRSARFTGKPYDEDLQAYVFPYRNYDASTPRWRSSDPAGYPDGINNQFYACVPTIRIDIFGLAEAALYGRPVQNTSGLFTHTSSRLSVTPSEYYSLTNTQQSYFARNLVTGELLIDSKGNYYTTISGFEKSNSPIPYDTYLDVRANDSSDAPGQTTKIGDILSNNMLDYIRGYLDDTYAYQQKQKQLDYDWFPNDPDETNCNAYQGSIMRRNGGKVVDNDGNEINVDAPGFNHNIGNKFFER